MFVKNNGVVLAIILWLKKHEQMILISQKVGRNVGLGRVLFAGGSDKEKVGYYDKARVRRIGGVRTKVGLRTASTNVPPQPTTTQPSGACKAPMHVPAMPPAW